MKTTLQPLALALGAIAFLGQTHLSPALEELSGYDYGVNRRLGTYRVLLVSTYYEDNQRPHMNEIETQKVVADSKRWWNEASFGRMNSVFTVLPPMKLPQAARWGSSLRLHFFQELKRMGFDPASYDVVLERRQGQGGLGAYGDGYAFLNATNHFIVVHEGGHGLGPWHTGTWGEPQRLPHAQSGSEGANPFDVMGSNYNGGFHCHYHVESKSRIGWLDPSRLHSATPDGSYRVTGDGTYRVYAIDQSRMEPGKFYGLRVTKDGHASYWFEHRGMSLSLPRQTLALYNVNGGESNFIDCSPNSYSDGYWDGFDAGLVPGMTYSDYESDMHFTLLSENATVPPSVDIVYKQGPFPGNRAPVIGDLTVSSASVAVGENVTFSAAATDEDNDPLVYHWDFGERSVEAQRVNHPSAPELSRSFSSARKVTAMLTVSDMKGGVARRHVLLDVGGASTRRVSGSVTVGGQPVVGARVRFSANEAIYAFTDSNGAYVLSDVPSNTAGSINAFKAGYTLSPYSLASGSGDAGGADFIAVESKPVVSLEKLADVAEGDADGELGFRIRRTGATDAALVVRMAAGLGNAGTSDYALSPNWAADSMGQGNYRTFTIPAGQSTLDVRVTATDDGTSEGDESLRMQLVSSPNYHTLAISAVDVGLLDNETSLPAVSVLASGGGVYEGGSAGVFRFKRSGPTAGALIVPLQWSGSAVADMTALPTTVDFAAGRSEAELQVSANADGQIEGEENLTVTVAAGAGNVAATGRGSATLPVHDAELPEVTVEVTDSAASESGDPGSFLIKRSGSTAAALTVYYNLTGLAEEGVDYRTHQRMVIIPAGRASVPVLIQPVQDAKGELPESVVITLSSVVREYRAGERHEAQLVISDEDPPTVIVETVETDGRITEGESAKYRFHAIGSGTGNVSVNYSLAGTSTSGGDYTVPAVSSVSVPINGFVELSITTSNDTDSESTESLELTITTGAGYSAGSQPRATLLVMDNDSGGERVGVSPSYNYPSTAWSYDLVTAFGEWSDVGGVGVTFWRSGTTGDLTVSYRVTGSATPGVDFTGLDADGTVVIPDGSSSVRVPLSMIQDTLAEPLESLVVEVVSDVGYGIDIPGSATVEIHDDDSLQSNGSPRTVRFQTKSTITSEDLAAGFVDIPVVLSEASGSPVSVRVEGYGALMYWGDYNEYLDRLESQWEPITATGGDDWEFLDASNGNLPVISPVVTFAPGQTNATVRVRLIKDEMHEATERFRIRLAYPSGASLPSGSIDEVHEVFVSDAEGDLSLVLDEVWSGTAAYDGNQWGGVVVDSKYLRGFLTEHNRSTPATFSRRLSGRFVVPYTGAYTFWVASDDQSRLYLSATGLAESKVKIVEVAGATGVKEWRDANKSGSQILTAGQVVYLELQHKDTGGGDHAAVAWQGPGFERRPLNLDYFAAGRPHSVGFADAELTVSESDGAADVLVVLDEPVGSTALTVDYAVTGGSASRGADYQLADGSLTFGPGEQFKRLPLTLLADMIGEAPELIQISLSNPSAGMTVSSPSCLVRIRDASGPGVEDLYAGASSAMASGTVLGTVIATPASGRVISSWSIVAGNIGNALAINAAGEVRLLAPGALPNPGAIQLVVRATDSSGATGEGYVNVICNSSANGVLEERWNGGVPYLNQVWSGQKTHTGYLSTFTTPQNVGDGFSRRLTGYLKPSVSGNYTFWIAGDDECRLFLSSDRRESGKKQIAQVVSWTNYQAWDTETGQRSASIPLVAGQIYWMEVHHLEGTGGDHVSVAWSGPGISRQAIPPAAISPIVAGADFEEPPVVPDIALAVSSSVGGFQTGGTAELSAVAIGGSSAVSSVRFYRGSVEIGSDTSAPFGVTWVHLTEGTHVLTAKATYSGGEVQSSPVTVQVVNPDPTADPDGDGFNTGLEFALGTNPYSSASQPEASYAGLVGWWKLNDAAGALADDFTGRPQDGTVSGATWTNGVDQGALAFDGVNDQVEVPATLLSGRSSFTLSGWFRTPTGAQSWKGLFGQNNAIELGIDNNQVKVWTALGGGLVSAPMPLVNEWHHVACVADGTTVKLYLDGVLATTGGSPTSSYGSSAYPFRIGGGVWGASGGNFQGDIDDVRVYARALSAAEVFDLVDKPSFVVGSLTHLATEGVAVDARLEAETLLAGASLTFTKTSGPAWLNVAADGSLSGVPALADRGVNTFTVRVETSGGHTATADLVITVNGVPRFLAPETLLPTALAGTAYQTSLVTKASDPEAGAMTFTKLSGPAWLTVASNGAVQGNPVNADLGKSLMMVRVSDGLGASSVGLMVVNVALPAPQNYGSLRGDNTSDEWIQRVRLADLDHTSGDNSGYADFTGRTANVLPGQTVNYVLTPGWSSSTWSEAWTIWMDVNRDGDFADAGEMILQLGGTKSERSGTVVIPVNASAGYTRMRIAMKYNTAQSSSTGIFNWGEVEDYSLLVGSNVAGNAAPYFISDPLNVAIPVGGSPSPLTLAGKAADWENHALVFAKVSGAAWLAVNPDGTLVGTPPLGVVGVQSFVVRVTDSVGGTDTATLQVDVAGSAFSNWLVGHGLSGPEAAVDADPDHDGIPNGLEFVVGGVPSGSGADSSHLLPQINADSSHLEFSFRRTDASAPVGAMVQYSGNLAGWNAAVDGQDGVTITTENDFYGAGVDRVTVYLPLGLSGGDRMFARLHVTIPQ